MESVEAAYMEIASSLVKVANEGWQEIYMVCPILGNGCGGVISIQIAENGMSTDLPIGWGVFNIERAALCLRDILLATTGDRIWGLTFTLYPDGKFNIEYDYSKPEGYEESDDVITGEEINQSLKNIGK